VTQDVLLENLHPNYRDHWTLKAEPKVFVYLFDGVYLPDATGRVDAITKALQKIGDNSARPCPNIIVSPPVAENQFHNNADNAPFAFLAHNFPAPLKTVLLANPVFSSSEVSFFVTEFNPAPSNFALALEGLTFKPDNATHIQSLRTLIQNAIVNSNMAMAFLQNLPSLAGNAVALHNILNSVQVECFSLSGKDGDRRVWNVYIDPPTTDNTAYNTWIGILEGLEYIHTDFGCGQARTAKKCSRCKSLDHPKFHCPFPRLAGWNGPAPIDATTPNNNANNNNPCGRGGFRGNGRGGGRGSRRGRGGRAW
jgi:hypothetical protein